MKCFHACLLSYAPSNCLELFMKGVKKTLVMREVPEDSVKTLLSNKESLAACDVAVFVHDRY